MRSQRSKRINNIRRKLASLALESLLITRPENITYLTGEIELSHDRHDAALLLMKESLMLLISPLREKPARAIARSVTIKKSGDFVSDVKTLCIERKIATVGFEEENLRVSEYKMLKKRLAPIALKPTQQVVENSRMIKDEEEIERIKKACRIAVSVYKKIRPFLSPGRTEKEVAWEIEKLVRSKGAEGVPYGFSPIAAFGSNTSTPHHISGNRKLKKRDTVLLDFGCTYRGYASDFTRTVFIGKPTDREKEVLAVVKKAQKLALESLAETDDPKKIDKAARDHIAKSGYGKFFVHSTGHGLGLSIHEAPSISTQEKTKIQPGMVFTLEPGVYLPGEFGIRLEDTILATTDGPEILTRQ